MKMNPLGRTGLSVSEICLGSMTWGTQNDEAEGHAQIDRALERGVNFIDTAEMYPTTPPSRERQGRTEEIIGSWFAKTGRREDVILATKVIGKGTQIVRDGGPITPAVIHTAVEQSLHRLQTDYIDLYQLHWPNRGSYHFRQSWTFDPSGQDTAATLADLRATLEGLAEEVAAGRIRHIGVSNDSAWGIMTMLRLADEFGLPRIASVQNEYSLTYRPFDLDLAEVAHNEDVGLLAYSPLAAGLLTGKYADGVPKASRADVGSPNLGGRMTERVGPAVAAYNEVARAHDTTLTKMAIAFCLSRPFMTSAIIGATSLAQLDEVLDGADLEFTDAMNDDITAVYRAHPWPY
ncbi:aryl-alcohol dehydrogenase-like predicted oxidoreductase [Rubricella aquisinus]|uniref:Aryl-alcohol dehydrogenase-like predicted oxidoreductase n=1 Tax=Rubricella aquisinus TaxID=2028108 RepID=A0A840WLL0_9RHOB|nr:aldo/keto reductase [Rubricella aquisinus]MBB5515421.1 aryl-alcohol dehydrogenase-like predicted oxidoreductase [Rubricella aquisinus]